MGDSAILVNGRPAQLTEAGWEVIPFRTDKKSLVFHSIAELDRWSRTHDYWGKPLSPAPDPPRETEDEGTP